MRATVFASAMIVIACLILLHGHFVVQLGMQSKKTSNREADLYAYAIAEELLHRQSPDFLDDVMKGSEVPLLFTTLEGTPRHWRNIPMGWGRRIPEIPWAVLSQGHRDALQEFVAHSIRTRSVHPIVVGGTPMGLLYHGPYHLDWELPALLAAGFLGISLLGLLTWFGLRVMQETERSMLWVGLAKETAHQLGTPISSLMGWLEYMRFKPSSSPEDVRRIAGEMDVDLQRLRQVVSRFSHIGSLPDLQSVQPNAVVQQIHDYFQPRLPHSGRTVALEVELGEVPAIRGNAELLGWVLENLIKNALDAIDRPEGRIVLRTKPAPAIEGVRIEVEDNGRGIPKEHLRDVFQAGWSTKKRGWGLGLALARRIVEQYHGGRIWVSRSRLGEGTLFTILLGNRSEG